MTGLNSKAQGKHNIVRVRSNDQSDLSDEFTHSTGANNKSKALGALNNNSNPSSSSNSNANSNSASVTATKGPRRARPPVQDGDSDDSSNRHAGNKIVSNLGS